MISHLPTNNQRLWRKVLIFLVAVIATLGFATPARAASLGTADSTEDVAATVEKSMVQLLTVWTGYVYFDKAAGGSEWSKLIETSASCSGFFVSSTGHIATAGHCVEPSGGRDAILHAFLNKQVSDGLITAAKAAEIWPSADESWLVESKTKGSAPTRTIIVGQPKAVEGTIVTDPLVAQLVEFRPFNEGDLALLKVEAKDTPPLSIATTDPKSSSALTAVGFPGSVGRVVDTSKIRASFKTGTASSHQISPDGIAQTEINAQISPGMSGGPTIDAVGNVLGVNSYKIVGETQSFNFITDTTDLKDWLSAKGVTLVSPKEARATGANGAKGTLPVSGPASADSGSGPPAWLWGLLALMFVMVLAAVAAVAWFKLRPAPQAASPMVPDGVVGSRPGDAGFKCHNCGQPSTGNPYCSNCGSQLVVPIPST